MKYLAYIRVSTSRQAGEGVSLQEQRRSINEYAERYSLSISYWYEEVGTAAKQGRLIFASVLKRLRKDSATGLLIHRIDRGVRNLRDWADLGELIDAGVDVRFVHDDLPLDTRGGRLSADIQAVISADYIRNLREEVRKGIYGRLKQGLYPLPAPIGYRDCGAGRVKMPDPVMAPLVILAFERYALGTYSFTSLAAELAPLGLRNRRDEVLPVSSMSALLRRSFYVGQCHVSGTTFTGIHQPLISRELFDRVQGLLSRRRSGFPKRTRRHFPYQRRLRCRGCSRLLTGERQKSHVYYRCHTCPLISVREDRISVIVASSPIELMPLPALQNYQRFELRSVSQLSPIS